VEANRTLVLAGGITNVSGGGNLGLNPQSGSKLIIKDQPLLLGSSTGIQAEYGGTVVFAVPSNTYSSMLICDHNRVRTDVANALSPVAQLTIGGSWVADALLDLNGFDQTVGGLKTDGNKTNPGYLAVTSTVPATLTVDQGGNTVFVGALDGAVSLTKKGAGTLIFSNVISQTTGDLLVASGTVAVAEIGGFAQCRNVRIAGGTFELRNGTALPDSATVWIADGAKLKLGTGVSETVCYLYYGAQPKRAGTYGSTASAARYKDDARFSGNGVLTVRFDKVPGTFLFVQ
jgi:autotransporter-associated beta strand protein